VSSAEDGLTFYSSVRFRPAVETEVRDTEATFRYRALSFDVEFPHGCRGAVRKLCEALANGSDMSQLKRGLPFAEEETHALLDTLDRFGLLTENVPSAPPSMLTGRDLWAAISELAERVKTTLSVPFTEALQARQATRAQLIAYAEQYLHVVRHGARIAAAAFASARTAQAEKTLETFAKGEFGHDRLLAASLVAVGLDPIEILNRNPWPETFAIISHLHVLADQDPLSFAGCLFVVEDATPEFHQAFLNCCRMHDLPEAFSRPILQHAAINDEGDHGNISRELLATVQLVSEEERDTVLSHVVTLLENLAALDQAIARAA
jgi:pyrroloquinoline quinone (PQQ) biosynthesis protein C